jgi:hypothetical protein
VDPPPAARAAVAVGAVWEGREGGRRRGSQLGWVGPEEGAA